MIPCDEAHRFDYDARDTAEFANEQLSDLRERFQTYDPEPQQQPDERERLSPEANLATHQMEDTERVIGWGPVIGYRPNPNAAAYPEPYMRHMQEDLPIRKPMFEQRCAWCRTTTEYAEQAQCAAWEAMVLAFEASFNEWIEDGCDLKLYERTREDEHDNDGAD